MTLVEAAVEAGRARERALSFEVKRRSGVVHTPAELARWALARVDDALRTDLGCEHGLASERVALLDPAVGTGVWLAAALERIAPGPGPSALAFDTDLAALASARCALERHGATLSFRHENTLEIENPWQDDARVRVVVGNPPWAARSTSRGLALSDRWLADFRKNPDGTPLGERRTGVLSDDYVRFFRWSLEQARTAPAGAIVCLATNSSYLEGPVYRSMRAALLDVFDRICVLDLGGNTLCENQVGCDESVFQVRVGSALTLAVRRPGAGARLGTTPVSYTRLRGSRRDKLAQLTENTVEPVDAFVPAGPTFRFTPPPGVIGVPSRLTSRCFSLDEAFPFHREGVQTNRDALVTDPQASRLFQRLQALLEAGVQVKGAPHLAKPRVQASLARALADGPDTWLRPVAYRPLDPRFVFALSPFCHRPRPDLARAVAHSRCSLLSARRDRGRAPWRLFGVAPGLADSCFLSTRSSCRTRVFPSHNPNGAENVEPRLALTLSALARQEITGTVLIHYVLGVLASESFRREQDAMLHLDYPRVPFPRDADDFANLVRAGARWAEPWLSDLPIEDGADERDAQVFAYDAEVGVLRTVEGLELEVSARAWSAKVGDFTLLPSLFGTKRKLSQAFARACVQRAEACSMAEYLAEEVRLQRGR